MKVLFLDESGDHNLTANGMIVAERRGDGGRLRPDGAPQMNGASPRYAVTSPRAECWRDGGNVQAPAVVCKLADWPRRVENQQDGKRP